MKLKKSLTFATSFAMICSMITPVLAQNQTQIKLQNPNVQQREKVTSVKYDAKALNVQENEEVRVVVELEEEPLIEYATKKGKKVKDLDKKTVDSVTKKIKDNQNKVKENAKSKGIKFEEHNSFTNVQNGFSITTTLKEAEQFESIQGVKRVTITNEYQRPEPQMNTSNDIVNAPQTWEALGYNGEGTVVAVIDTGVDPSHKDMVLSDNDKAEYTETEINDIKGEKELDGTYRTEKVPYGYNYMDNNQEILDLGPGASEHGMHVAGTVGANGDIENGGIKGVAPETQILAMKVFGNNPQMPSTFGDVIIKAIDDSIALGADVINMSLGSTAAYVLPDDPEQIAVKRAQDNGVVCAISAGNSDVFGSGWDLPYAKNPDIGVVGSPGLSSESIQVASIENTHVTAETLEYVLEGESVAAGYINAGSISMFETFKGQPAEYVHCGLGGSAEEFPSEVKGKIALIERGAYAFVDKIMNAQNAGATGVIIYNHEDGGEGLINMQYPNEANIPAIFIGNSHGKNLDSMIESGQNKIEFKGEKASVSSPSAGMMSDFTSWGVTPDLEFKPEITAPGGNIWSTAQDNEYQGMSGTSMAAPHVAGGASLVLQRVDEEFKLEGQERVTMAKNLLMSTAKAHEDQGDYQFLAGEGNYTSPRRQGAGVMDLYAATTTPVVVTAKDSGISKVNLKEIGDKAQFTVTLQNFSNEDVIYKVNGNVQTDLTDGAYNYLQAQSVYKAKSEMHPISFDKEEVKVPANETTDVVVSVDLSNAVTAYEGIPLKDMFESGTFVEGFVTFTDVEDKVCELSIPYLGFYGEWDDASVIDDTNYDTEATPFYGYTAMSSYDNKSDSYSFLGYDLKGNADANNIAFSPNNDGNTDSIVPVLSFLRNAREIDIDILDKNGDVVRDLAVDEYIRKNYHDGIYAPYTIDDMWTWDGKINNKVASDGEYTYRVRTKIDMENSNWQEVNFPVKIDTKKPVIKEFNYDDENKTLDIVANDGDNQIYAYVIVDNGEVVYRSSTNETIDLKTLEFSNKAELRVYDYAGNYVRKNVPGHNQGEVEQPTTPPTSPEKPSYKEPTGVAEGDTTIPTIDVLTPEFLSVQNKETVVFSGTIEDESNLEYFTVNGEKAEYKFDTSTGKWDFAVELKLEEGYNAIQFAAKDLAGNHIDFTHKIFSDTKGPVINLDAVSKTVNSDTVTLSGKITDNLPGLRVRVNGNMLANLNGDWEEYPDRIAPVEYELDYTVKLEKGKNTIIIEAEDDAGNVTTKKIDVRRK